MDLKAPIIKRNGWAEFCASLFQWRNVLHIVHLKSKSLAEHLAVEDAYSGLLSIADEITEMIQGYKGLLEIEVSSARYQEPIAFLKEKRNVLIAKQKECSDMPDVQNKLQDLIGLFSRTIYKLENLK